MTFAPYQCAQTEETGVQIRHRQDPCKRLLLACLGRAFLDWRDLEIGRVEGKEKIKLQGCTWPVEIDEGKRALRRWFLSDDAEPFCFRWIVENTFDGPEERIKDLRKKLEESPLAWRFLRME